MLLYILLSLGQVFANQELAKTGYSRADYPIMADFVYECLQLGAGKSENTGHTVREVAQQCSDKNSPRIKDGSPKKKDDNIGIIKIDEAKITLGSTIILKVSWNENGIVGEHFYSFNTVGTVLHNDCDKPGAVKTLVMNLDTILSHTENSVSANSCAGTEIGGGMGGYSEGGFGFKNKKNKCERICPAGQILVGEMPPFIFSNTIGTNVLMTQQEISGQMIVSPQLLGKQCVVCPVNHSRENGLYTQTKENSNKCYEGDHWCEEGTEYYPGAPPSLHWGTATNDCTRVCEDHEKRNKGICEPDEKKSCERLTKMKGKLKSLTSRLLAAANTGKVGTCDMSKMRSLINEWASSHEEKITESLKGNCKDSKFFTGFIPPTNFMNYFIQSNYTGGTAPCLGTIQGSSRNLDANIYEIMSEDFMSDRNPRVIY
jgi:hypothetical protein